MNHNIDYPKILSAILRNDFASFVNKVFNTLNPSVKYSSNWHINLIAGYLQNIKLHKKLIINIPPRCLKSVCISVAWPAWLLGLNPSCKIIVASYSQSLSIKHSLDCLAIMQSSWYQKTFPNTILKRAQRNKFETTEFGFRLATSVGGTITGEGADVLIIDDPHNPTHIHSNKIRQKTLQWYEQTFVSRLNNPAEGAIVILMQRLHKNDLCGYLLEKSNKDIWNSLSIPALAREDIKYKSFDITKNNLKYYIFKQNTSIDPIRFPLKLLEEKIEKEMGEYNFRAQYLQDPIDCQKGILSIKDIRYYASIPNFQEIIQSWDTAIKIAESSDFSVCTTWGVYNSHYYLLDLICEKFEYRELKLAIVNAAKKWNPLKILIEDKASGQQLIQDLKYENIYNVYPQKPKLDKATRFALVLPFFTTGAILLPELLCEKKTNILQANILQPNILKRKLLQEAVEQLTNFPYSKHDDIVDSITQFLSYITSSQMKHLSIRRL